MKAPRVSVVIDNYNYGRFLREALDSVLSQGLPEWELEVIVADDGSTDDSRAILAEYAPRVKALLQERQGQATAFNVGIRAAKGDIVCLLDSDDAWLPGKLAAVLKAFEDPKVGCVQHYLHDTDAKLAPLPRRMPVWPERYRLGDFLEGRTRFTATSGLSFRREILLKCLPLPKNIFYYLDDYLTIRSMFFSETANLNVVLGWHRVHGDNWCAGGYESPLKIERDFANRAILAEALDSWLKESGKARTQASLEDEALELYRRRVLLAALSARPLDAWKEWLKGLRERPPSPMKRFRAATTFLAVLSPTLYLSFYELYSIGDSLRGLRLRLFPAS